MNENQDSVFEPVEHPASMPVSGAETEPKAAPEEGFCDRPVRRTGDSFSRPQTKTYDAEDAESFYFSTKPPRKKHTGLLVCLGCLLIALLAAGGWWLLNNLRRDPLGELKLAAGNTVDLYLDYVKDLPNLHQYSENSIAFLKSDSKRVELNASMEGNEEIPNYRTKLSVDRDGSARKTLLHGEFETDELNIPLDVYVDRDQIQIGSSTLLDAGEALAFPVKDFGKKWNASVLSGSDFADAKLPENFSLSFLTDGMSEKSMKDAFGSDWSSFTKSVSYRKATAEDGESCFGIEGEIYVLSWDQELLSKMGTRANTLLQGSSIASDADKMLPAAIMKLLNDTSSEISAPQFLVSDNALLGVCIRNAAGDQAFVCELTGEGNPWARCAVSFLQANAAKKMEVMQTIEMNLTVANGQLQAKCVQTSPNGGESNVILESVYNDADGRMSIAGLATSFDLEEMPVNQEILQQFMQGVDFFYKPTANGGRVEYSMDMGKILGSTGVISQMNASGMMHYSIEFSSKTESIQPLSKEPTQFLELSKTSLSVLVMRIYNKIGSLSSLDFD